MSQQPQSGQKAANKKSAEESGNKNFSKTLPSRNNGNLNNENGSEQKRDYLSSQRQTRQKNAGVSIKRKKNQDPFSFYKEVCQKLNVNLNNVISSGFKGDEFIINIDNLAPSDVDPMRVLMRECDFSSIILQGNKEFDEEQFYSEHNELTQKYHNTATLNNNNSNSNLLLNGMASGNNFQKIPGGFAATMEGQQNDQGDGHENKDGRFSKTPQHNNTLGRNKTGEASNKNIGGKELSAGFKRYMSGTDGSNSNKNSQSKSNKSKKNFSNQTQSFVSVMNAIGVNIGKTPKTPIQLTSVKISNLNMKAESLAGICKGLQKSNTVKELYIQNCGLTSEAIEKGMVEYMTEIKSLISLDLSFNKLNGQSGGFIGKLLSSHSKNRDEHIWLCGLRGEVPENDVNLEGICEINLMGNQLNDKSIRDLCYFLQFDGWTRSVNLRYNRIGADGLVELDKMLDNNENLISLDIRNNPGMTPNYDDFIKFGEGIKFVSKNIYDKLLSNIKIFKQKRDEMRKKQSEQFITNLQYDNNNQPLPQNFFPQTQDEAAIMMMALHHQQQHPEQNIEDHILYAQQQQQLMQNALMMQQQQQNMIPQQQNYYPQQVPQHQVDQSYQGHKSKQNSQAIQGQDIQNQQINQNGQVIHQQQGHLPQEQHYENEEEYHENYVQKQEGEAGHEGQGDQEHHQEGEDLNAEELNQQQLILKEKQNFIFSEEFLEIQQQNFQEIYGENEEFLSLPEEQQAAIYQQFFTHQQEQYLQELENEVYQTNSLTHSFFFNRLMEQMEGVQEVQEEQYEEDDEEEQPHDNLYNEQQMYYQQNEGTQKQPQNSDNAQQNKQGQPQNVQSDLQHQEDEVQGYEDADATDQNQGNNDEREVFEEEEEQDEESIKLIMEQIYEELQLDSIVDKNCKCCIQLQDKILQSEYEKLNLMIKLNNCQVRLARIEKQSKSSSAVLKQQIQQLQIAASQQNQQFQQQQIANSWSAIQPNTIDQDGNNMIMDPQSFLLGGGAGKQQQQLTLNPNNQGNEPVEGEDMLNRIEGLMTELTRLMDNLETMQNNVTNNITCQLSNTTNTNNQTYQLLNSNPNFNNTFTNILGGSHNNSNILPRNPNQNFLNNLTQQTQQQTSTFVPSQSSNNNTQIQQVSSTQSGQKKSKMNSQKPQVQQQQYYQQQQQILHSQQQQQYGQFEQQQQEQFNYNAKQNIHNNSR